MKNREIHLRDVAKALAWMLRLLVEENRRFNSRQVGKGVLLEQKPAVNDSYGWSSPGFPKVHLQKQYTFNCFLFDSPTKHQWVVPFVVSLCLMILEDKNPPVASSHNQLNLLRSPQAVSPCGGYLAVANAMTVTVLMAQIWVKLQKVIEIPTSFSGENW